MKPLSKESVRVAALCVRHSGGKVSQPNACDSPNRKKGAPGWAWGKVPLAVSRDLRLSRVAIGVYVELAWACWVTAPNVELGGRLIAERLGVSKDRVYRGLRELVKCGHVERFREGKGMRVVYRMTGQAFEPMEKMGSKYSHLPKVLRKGGELPDGMKSAPRGWKKEAAG